MSVFVCECVCECVCVFLCVCESRGNKQLHKTVNLTDVPTQMPSSAFHISRLIYRNVSTPGTAVHKIVLTKFRQYRYGKAVSYLKTQIIHSPFLPHYYLIGLKAANSATGCESAGTGRFCWGGNTMTRSTASWNRVPF